MGSRNAKPPKDPSPGRPHGLLARYTWPGSGETMTVGEAIPRQMRTVGCTWDEAAAFVGVGDRALSEWLRAAARINRQLAAGRDEAGLSDIERALYRFIVDVDQAAAEVTVRWQGILEQEGRGGYELKRTTTVERRDADGKLIETRTETVIEKARPDVKAIMWKMEKQLRRYRRERELLIINATGGNGIVLPDPSDDEAAQETADAIRAFQQRSRGAIEASAVEANGHG